ncbi:24582_t:CDS:2 [Dentiscutata erythropus]|uniref:Beta-hexosaminidase n=1 Tax=Dentiscutata erythropus TaxID=1348616 RepID=A0A9N8Z705_9GLOM|nr:24582_t:CDS:2 [Dentiscutata erythropus]
MSLIFLKFSSILILLIFPNFVNSLWPLPQNWSNGTSLLRVYPTFTVKYDPKFLNSYTDQLIESAKNRLQIFLKKEKHFSPNVKFQIPEDVDDSILTLSSINIEITDNLKKDQDDSEEEYIDWTYNKEMSEGIPLGTDESYELIIPDKKDDNEKELIAYLKAPTVYGILHGLTTFSQLLYYNRNYEELFLPFAPHNIKDFPKFMHRGLLLDTSRNFYPIKEILKTLDVMSWNKMNVFHWHIVDSTSWPVVSEKYPELSEKGAYDPKKMIYTKRDIRIVDEYARARGIRVIPEFDMPGHTYAIAASMPEIMTCTDMYPDWDKYSAEPPSGQLNPAIPETYTFLNELVPEIASYFTDKFYHTGGDEVNMNCWETLVQQGDVTIESLLDKFVTNLYTILKNEGKIPMTWQEMITEHNIELPKDTVVQVWKNHTMVKKVVEKGYRVVTGSGDYWYLDCGHGGWLGNNVEGKSWCDPYKTWQMIYSYNPIKELSDEEAKFVIGGEVLLWSEQSDPTNYEQQLWPRSSAAAEVLWSGPEDVDGNRRVPDNDALKRLNDWRFRMVERGINAEPLQPLWCVLTGRCDKAVTTEEINKNA